VVSGRVPVEPRIVNANNREYLLTKIQRMNHLMDLGEPLAGGGPLGRAASH
jgi:hypothetical protein